MKLTAGRYFADSNILLYLLSNVDYKKDIAKEILISTPVISTQVVAENINIAFKKFTILSAEQISLHKAALINSSELVLIDDITINIAFDIKIKYKFQWFDSLIIASALKNNCETLYTEDLQHLQKIDSLTIVNPFI